MGTKTIRPGTERSGLAGGTSGLGGRVAGDMISHVVRCASRLGAEYLKKYSSFITSAFKLTKSLSCVGVFLER